MVHSDAERTPGSYEAKPLKSCANTYQLLEPAETPVWLPLTVTCTPAFVTSANDLPYVTMHHSFLRYVGSQRHRDEDRTSLQC